MVWRTGLAWFTKTRRVALRGLMAHPPLSACGRSMSRRTRRRVSASRLDLTDYTSVGLFKIVPPMLDTFVKVSHFDSNRTTLAIKKIKFSGTLNGTTEIDIAPTESRRGCQCCSISSFINQLFFLLLDDFLCPNSWNLIGKSCFRRNDALKTWHESLANCERWSERWRKGSLVSTSSLQEMNRLSGMLGVREAWIGLNDIDSEGMYNWTDGSPYFYARWSSSESTKTLSDRETHDCVAATTTGWNSRDCFQKLSSVCSMPAIFGMRHEEGSMHTCNHTCNVSLDFDECHNNSHNCSVDASCVNTLDSFECVCNIGFSGNGTTCIGICDICTCLRGIFKLSSVFRL